MDFHANHALGLPQRLALVEAIEQRRPGFPYPAVSASRTEALFRRLELFADKAGRLDLVDSKVFRGVASQRE